MPEHLQNLFKSSSFKIKSQLVNENTKHRLSSSDQANVFFVKLRQNTQAKVNKLLLVELKHQSNSKKIRIKQKF